MNYEGIVYRPPSEAMSFILQVTIGCAHNSCTFCTMYKDKKFRIRKMDEIVKDIREVHSKYGDNIRRIFLADGDALVIPYEQLFDILFELKRNFPSAERITSYGAPKDVLTKTDTQLKGLNKAGLDMVYMGLESGDDVILQNIKKGVSALEIVTAGQKLKDNDIKTSITLISGLGGRQRLNEHAIKSAEAVSKMNPDFVGFLTLLLEHGAPMLKDLQSGKFSFLSPDEVLTEMEIFLKEVDSDGTVFRANHASNYVSLKGTLNRDIKDMLDVIKRAREKGSFKDDSFRAL